MDEIKKSSRGFASMTPDRLREIARLGGTSTPADKRAFARDRKLASTAGAKGGRAGKFTHPPIDAEDEV